MIIVRISGGIGNQLFQYALGRALTLRNGRELKLDLSFYEMGIEKDRPFKLPNFKVPPFQVAAAKDFKKLGVPNPKSRNIYSRIVRKFYRNFGHLLPLGKRKIFMEQSFSFCPDVRKIENDCYLVGVWQSEKYFAGYADEIRKDFELSAPLSPEAERVAREIESSRNSVSLHVRRGDQVANPHLLAKHGNLSEDYYRRAVDYIVRAAGPVRLFIFSDEISWCKENLRFDLPAVYVEGGSIKDYEEMALMSRCTHNVIAKSSFSWWGAWLNRNPQKIVIAPRQRFGSDSQPAPDLIPDSWIKI